MKSIQPKPPHPLLRRLVAICSIACLAAVIPSPLPAQTPYVLDSAPNLTLRTRGGVSLNSINGMSQGRLLVTGSVRYVDSTPVEGVVRLLANGALDGSFVAPADLTLTAAAVTSDDKIWAAAFSSTGGSVLSLVRLHPDGTMDPAVAPVDISTLALREIIALPDGGCYLIDSPQNSTRILRFDANGQPFPGYIVPTLTGSLISPVVGPNSELALVRQNSSGPASVLVISATGSTLPASTAIPSNFRPFAATFDPSGSLVLVGQTFTGTGPGLIRILPNGTRDTSFSGISPFNNFAGSDVVPVADGGFATLLTTGAPTVPQILRFSSTGVYQNALPITALPDFIATGLTLQSLADGGYLLAGRFLSVNGVVSPTLAKISSAGQVDANFQADLLGQGRVTTLTAFGEDGYLLAGTFSEFGSAEVANAAALTGADTASTPLPLIPNGGIFRSFSTNDGGAVLLGGGFAPLAGTTTTGLAKLKSDGTVDTTFVAGLTLNSFEAGLQQPDGKIVLVGRFGTTPPSATAPTYLMRVLADGTPDPTFNNRSTATATGLPANVLAVALNSDGALLIAGNFTMFQGQPRPGLAKVNAEGVIDPSFVPAVGLKVSTSTQARNITVLPDGRFYLLGTRADSATNLSKLLRFNPDGSIDESFAPALGDRSVASYTMAGDGSIFASVGAASTLAPAIVRIDASGQIDPSFNYETNSTAQAMVIDELDRLLIGGAFQTVAGETREGLARFRPLVFSVAIDGPNVVTVRWLHPVQFHATVTDATGPVFYQWYHNGKKIPLATKPTLKLPLALFIAAGDYTVKVTAGTKVVTSQSVQLKVKLF